MQTSAKGAGSISSKAGQSKTSESPDSSDDEYGERDVERLEVIQDEDEFDPQAGHAVNNMASNDDAFNPQSSVRNKTATRQSSETPSLIQDKGSSPTPSTDGSISQSSFEQVGGRPRFYDRMSIDNSGSGSLRSGWSHLPADLQFYLAFFCQNITYMHYSLRSNFGGFIHALLLDAALRNEPLLYAVVGFSAFQYSVEKREGKIQDFLQYYNKAVSLLLKSLKKGAQHTTYILLAILQLATIEVCTADEFRRTRS